jgi:transcriptional antiterminator
VSTNQQQFKIEERRRQVASLIAQSLTERQIAAQLSVSQPTIHRDIDALKEMSQRFVFDLAKSDLAYYYKQSIDGLDEVKKHAWTIYHSTNENIQIKDRLAALRLIADCNVEKFELLNAGPSVLAMKSLEERLSRIEIIETPETTQ